MIVTEGAEGTQLRAWPGAGAPGAGAPRLVLPGLVLPGWCSPGWLLSLALSS